MIDRNFQPETSATTPGGKSARIALFGIFGIQNLGNECTLQAMAHNIRRRKPEASLYCISYVPEETQQRHDISAVPVRARYDRKQTSSAAWKKNRFVRLLRIVFLRIPQELGDWLRIFRTLRRTDLMIMTGTGMLTDFSTSAFGYPYDIFRWVVAARLAGCSVRFVGIGAGPIYEPLSQWFIKIALACADYRSFRDLFSKSRLDKLGINTSQDSVYPDLAFSLPTELFERASCRRAQCVVGLGVINTFDPRAQGAENQDAYYTAYLEKTASFVHWLVQNRYFVRILHGDIKYDLEVRQDLRSLLEQQGIQYAESGIVDDRIDSVEDLLDQLADTDLVISPRYHNLLLAMMLNKPVISLSYDPKNDALLEGVGLARFCQPLDEMDVDKLIKQFIEMEKNLRALADPLPKKLMEYRTLLDQQYIRVLGDL